MTETLELLLLSDVHNGPPFEAKAGPLALRELRAVLEHVEGLRPDLLIDLGDRINNTDAEQDARHMSEVAAAFEASSKERHHLLGNHDVKLLSRQDNERLLGRPLGHRLLHRAGWTLILWSPAPQFQRDGCVVPPDDVEWLAKALDRLDRPAVLFTHVPLGGGSMRSNYYFEGDPSPGASYRDLTGLQELVVANEHMKLAVAGHVHWNSLNVIDGVPFLTIQSLSELATTAPRPAGAWAMLSLESDSARLDVQGLDQFQVSLPLRRRGQHWLRRPGMPGWHAPSPLTSPAHAHGVILDLDGVIYRGDELLPGAVEFVAHLRSRGIPIVAVSNHSGTSAGGLAAKLQRLGVPLDERQVITSIDATVAYLAEHYDPNAPTLVVGSHALQTAVAAAGLLPSAQPELVVVGYQDEYDVDELAAAAAAVAAGASLIGTNSDSWLPTAGGVRRPETGPYLAMVAAMAGRPPAAIVGKPNQAIGNIALSRLGLTAGEVMVVGDTLATDIGLAKSLGATSVLVLTGNTSQNDLMVPRPDFVFRGLIELTAEIGGVGPTIGSGAGVKTG